MLSLLVILLFVVLVALGTAIDDTDRHNNGITTSETPGAIAGAG